MSAATLSGASLTAAQSEFTTALPSMTEVISYHFRRWPSRTRDDMIADTCAALWAAWHSLVRRGKDPVQVGITGIASRCCFFSQAGRKVGNKNTGRACLDVLDRRAQTRLGIKILSLDGDDERATGAPAADWHEWLAENNRVTPADEAAFRIDFGLWLASLPERKRKVAALLLLGHRTGEVAGMFGITAGAVSQTRSSLESSWRAYQGEDTSGEVEPSYRSVSRPSNANQGAPHRPRQQTAVHA